jgi:hypothetical protein
MVDTHWTGNTAITTKGTHGTAQLLTPREAIGMNDTVMHDLYNRGSRQTEGTFLGRTVKYTTCTMKKVAGRKTTTYRKISQ